MYQRGRPLGTPSKEGETKESRQKRQKRESAIRLRQAMTEDDKKESRLKNNAYQNNAREKKRQESKVLPYIDFDYEPTVKEENMDNIISGEMNAVPKSIDSKLTKPIIAVDCKQSKVVTTAKAAELPIEAVSEHCMGMSGATHTEEDSTILVYPFNVGFPIIEQAANAAFSTDKSFQQSTPTAAINSELISTKGHSVQIQAEHYQLLVEKKGYLNDIIIDFWMLW